VRAPISVHIGRATPEPNAATATTTATANEKKPRRRESLALFVREQVDGSAESWLRVFNDYLSDANAVGKEAYPDRAPVTAASFSGAISDHNNGEKKADQLLEEAAQKVDAKMKITAQMFCWNHK
jgi:hypothetical protein